MKYSFMHKIFFALITVANVVSAAATVISPPVIPGDEDMEAEIKRCVASMTIEEKVGQMCELTLSVISSADPRWNPTLTLDKTKLNHVISRKKVGSILNTADIAITPEQWYRVVKQVQDESMKGIGIPCIYGLDMNHGASYTMGATLFPQNINMAATFNPNLAFSGGEITEYETRACNVPWTYNPTVDLARNPLWPRFWENYGEDAYLSSVMATATVRGMQGTNPNKIDRFHIAANIKHYMGYGSPVSGKDRTHSSISEQEMREKHFAPYLEAIVKGGALSIMVNSTTNNGIPFHANARYLNQWLKEELDWDGLIVTDWADINNLYQREYVAANKKEAIAMAINAGIDMAMEPYDTDFCDLLIECVNEGLVPMSRIDDAVSRVLRMKYRLNLFKVPDTKYTDYPKFASKEFADVSRQAAVESMVLLKNDDNILPIKKDMKILVTGPNANSMRCLNGGWTYLWQGHMTDELPISKNYKTILAAMQDRFGKDNVVYEPGMTYGLTDQWVGNWGVEHVGDFDKVIAATKDIDIVVACIGETSYCETQGNINDLNLSTNQIDLVNRLYATGKPVVLILNEGRPRLINSIVPGAKAIVNIMLPSNYGGEALASLLAGDENFSGRLPFTYPKHHGALVTYDYKKGEVSATMAGVYNYEATIDVQWLFGYGLSYTTFKYSNLCVNRKEFTHKDTLSFSVDVTNTGSREGMESVLLFSSDLVATTSPDIRRLRAFDKISLKPGETKTVTLELPASDLAYVGYDEHWILEAGDFRITTGDQAINIKQSHRNLSLDYSKSLKYR